MVSTSKRFPEKVVVSIVSTVVGVVFGTCITLYMDAKNSQAESLKSEAEFWKERSNLLKDNIDKMKAEADKIVDKCSREKLQDEVVEDTKKKIDDIYRDTIPTSFKIKAKY